MADPELEAIRQRRMQELMAKQGMGTQQNPDQQKAQDEAKREADERRQMMLTQILTSEARARGSNVSKGVSKVRLKACLKARKHKILLGDRVIGENHLKHTLLGVTSMHQSMEVARIALVKPDKARGVEDVILRAAQYGQITEKVSEQKLIELLEQINTQTTKQTKVTIQRRRNVLEDDD